MTGQVDVYIASPFFNPEQVERVEQVKKILIEKGLTFYSPKDECVCDPKAGHDFRQKVFAMNCRAIGRCKIILAITNDKDPGTIWEAGYAFGRFKPVIYYCSGIKQFNLMLAESAVAVFTDLEKLKEYDFFSNLKVRYEGEIE